LNNNLGIKVITNQDKRIRIKMSESNKQIARGTYHVLLFYRFVPLDDLISLKSKLLDALSNYEIKGRILIAPEGINGTLASWDDTHKSIINSLVQVDARFIYTDWKVTSAEGDNLPFVDLFIKISKELIGTGLLGRGIFDANCTEYSESSYGGLSESSTGIHLTPKEFHEVLLQYHQQRLNTTQDHKNKEHENIVLLDVRNDIEYQVGHFAGATNLETNYYSESWKRFDQILVDKLHASAESNTITTSGSSSSSSYSQNVPVVEGEEKKAKEVTSLTEAFPNTKIMMYCTGKIMMPTHDKSVYSPLTTLTLSISTIC
jgi:predicted sulfurtransferase